MSGSSRVSIPSSVRRTIQNIKEIAGSHSDEEIYAMLKECSMDPDETAHKLLLQARPDKEIREKFYGELAMKASNNNSDKGGFTDILRR